MCCISFHEEIRNVWTCFLEADAAMLLNEAKALGVNMIRLAHYPQNEYTVRLAEKMGFLLWQEIPIWQGIDFTDNDTRKKAQRMLSEMIKRDQNRCAVGYWGYTPMKHSLPKNGMNSLLPCSKRESNWTLPACMLPLSTLCTSIAKNSVL